MIHAKTWTESYKNQAESKKPYIKVTACTVPFIRHPRTDRLIYGVNEYIHVHTYTYIHKQNQNNSYL